MAPVPGLEPTALARAQEHFRRAVRAADTMTSSTDIVHIEDGWLDFLNEIHRAFQKLKKACEKGPAKGWYDAIEKTRKGDELLSYIRHARNADEHGIDIVAGVEAFQYWLNPATGIMQVEHTEHGLVWYMPPMQIYPPNPLAKSERKLMRHLARVILRRVTDRGTTYMPPKKHLGKDIHPSEWYAQDVANLALRYLDEAFKEGIQKFPPSRTKG